MLPGVLGPQAAAALGLVEPGPLDGRRRTVGYELEQLKIAVLEAVPDAGADLHDPDDVAADEQRGGHERGHPLVQQGTVWVASRTSLTITAWAHDATSPTTPSPTGPRGPR